MTIKEFEQYYGEIISENVNIICECLKEGNVLLDIGANTGFLSSLIYNKVKLGKLILVEPIKDYYNECVKKFNDKSNVEIVNVGFSDKNEVQKILCSIENLGYNKIFVEGMEILPHFIEEVYCYKFSDWVGDREIDFIKIDAEGHDTKIINGMIEWLDKIEKKPYILFEGNWYINLENEIVNNLIERYSYSCENYGRDILMLPKK
jgi:FkbM family methyltransferase